MWVWWRLIWLLIDHPLIGKRNSILYGISASFDRAALQISQKTSISAFQFIVFIVGNCCGLCSWHIVVKVTTLLLLKSNLAINLKQDFSFIMDSMDKRGRHLWVVQKKSDVVQQNEWKPKISESRIKRCRVNYINLNFGKYRTNERSD